MAGQVHVFGQAHAECLSDFSACPTSVPVRLQRTTDRRAHAESGIWLTPLSEAGASESSRRSLFNIGVDAYLSLVDAVGRQVRAGKGGVIPAALQPILERLDRDVESWLAALHRTTEQLWGTTIGSGASLAREAARRRRRWVVDPLRAPA